MEREPRIERDVASEEGEGDDTAREVAGLDDEAFGAYIEALGVPPALDLTDEEEETALAEAEADIAAGRVVPHEAVMAWATKLGTPDEEPMPREWFE